MEGIAVEVGQKLKSAIKAKLKELGAYVDDELSNYVMVMVTNRRSKTEMDRELQLFLGTNTSTFTSWLQSVWLKLEQVTVTNSGIEGNKRKMLEKKKKTKKGVKSSSESDDNKKHKKKRKTSISDIVTKDLKKRKMSKVASSGSSKTELFSEERENTICEFKKHNDEPDSIIEGKDTFVLGCKKSNKDVADNIEEEDFLNIKEDFETEFLSDNEYAEGNMKNKFDVVDEYTKKTSLKLNTSEKSGVVNVILEKKDQTKLWKSSLVKGNDKTENSAERKSSPDTQNNNAAMNEEDCKNSTSLQLSAEKNTDVTKASKVKLNRRPLIRNRKLKSRSRSGSPSRTFKSRSKSPLKTRAKPHQFSRSRSGSFSRSRSKSDSPPSHFVQLSKGKSTIIVKSKSRSPTSNGGSKLIKIPEKSPSVVDARELINRKRAMILASEQSVNSKDEKVLMMRLRKIVETGNSDFTELIEQHKPTTISLDATTGSKIIRIKNRERSKENLNVINSIDDDDYYNVDLEENYSSLEQNDKLKSKYDKQKAVENKFGRFVVSKRDGRRSVTVHSNLEKNYESNLNSTTIKNDIVDLREIRRTVYIDDKKNKNIRNLDFEKEDDNDDEGKEKEEKIKLCKSVVNQIAKYIKEEPMAASNAGKVTKITRPKAPTQLASSTLIRKAVADARKSLNSTKEEFLKKKDSIENKNAICSKEKSCEDKNIASEQLNSKNEENSMQSEDTINIDGVDNLSSKSQNVNTDYNGEEKLIMKNDSPVSLCQDEIQTDEIQEEYDPSQNMPQFVVTLTGLDPKLFPQGDMETDLLDPTDLDDNKLKPKLQERCKYYPNCLAGEQCLFFHPITPCKMFPNCKYGNNCLYIHPKCKFDTMCTRYDCTFLHSVSRIATPVSARHTSAPPVISAQPCKFNYSCVNPLCPFVHPKICRFDRFCTNKNCTFSHTSRSHVFTFPKDKLKWSRPKDNEIKSDSADSKTEYDPSVEN